MVFGWAKPGFEWTNQVLVPVSLVLRVWDLNDTTYECILLILNLAMLVLLKLLAHVCLSIGRRASSTSI
jgi:hypothetical protein